MNLLLWERQILHFNYGLLYIWKTCRTCSNNLMSFTKERGEIWINQKPRHFFIMTLVNKLSQKGELGGPGWFVCFPQADLRMTSSLFHCKCLRVKVQPPGVDCRDVERIEFFVSLFSISICMMILTRGSIFILSCKEDAQTLFLRAIRTLCCASNCGTVNSVKMISRLQCSVLPFLCDWCNGNLRHLSWQIFQNSSQQI